MLQPLLSDDGSVVGTRLTFNNGGDTVDFSQTCARTLEYPHRMYVTFGDRLGISLIDF